MRRQMLPCDQQAAHQGCQVLTDLNSGKQTNGRCRDTPRIIACSTTSTEATYIAAYECFKQCALAWLSVEAGEKGRASEAIAESI